MLSSVYAHASSCAPSFSMFQSLLCLSRVSCTIMSSRVYAHASSYAHAQHSAIFSVFLNLARFQDYTVSVFSCVFVCMCMLAVHVYKRMFMFVAFSVQDPCPVS